LFLQADEKPDDAVRFRAQKKPHIQGDLIIAAARGMQLFTRLARAPDQFFFNGHVNIFIGRIKNKPALPDIGKDGFQTPG
jgi:hypothetical protein